MIATAAAAGGASAKTGHIDVTVKPKRGGPSTSFQISFVVPQPSGVSGGVDRRYLVEASEHTHPSGCVSGASADAPSAPAHTRVRVTLDPKAFPGSRWCGGSFHGTIDELVSPACPPRKLCPLFVALLKNLGKFSFHVKQGSRHEDTIPPKFAGLKRAFACTPGPQRPGETTPYTLSWDAATDDITPSSKIVYDVYMSTTQGGENFSTPNWTTTPGVTTFKTPGLASHGTFYFVVRARDRAGNEDHNRVERRGLDPCV